MLQRLKQFAAPILPCLVFFLTGIALLPYPGPQNDELFFSGPLYAPDSSFFRLEVFGWKIPFMVMSYSGALKTWLYAGIFRFLAADQWSLRLPVLLMGLGTIWLTWCLVRRLAGTRAAAVTVALLATDTMFLMTNLFDWGTVAIQHLLLMAGMLAAHLWLSSRTSKHLVIAAACWGLGLWDKALLVWPLVGLGLASFFLYPRLVAQALRPRVLGLGLASFLLAAAPLVWYNVARPGETATQNTHLEFSELKGKIEVLRQTVNATSLYNYMIFQDQTASPRPPRTSLERLSVRLASLAGDHYSNWMLPAWLVGFAFSLALWRSSHFRLLLFLLLATLVCWVQMALTKGAGGATHHTILLWPLPPMILGIAFSEVAARIPRFGAPVLWTAVGVLCAQNLLTTNQYLARFIVNGPGAGWTDAVYRLAETTDHKTASWYGLVDWGYLNALRLLHEGDLPMFVTTVPAEGQSLNSAEKTELTRQISNPDFLFIRHTADKEMFRGINERLRKAAADLGYTEALEGTVPDRNGRPVFELFRFRKEGT